MFGGLFGGGAPAPPPAAPPKAAAPPPPAAKAPPPAPAKVRYFVGTNHPETAMLRLCGLCLCLRRGLCVHPSVYESWKLRFSATIVCMQRMCVCKLATHTKSRGSDLSDLCT